MSSLNAFHVSPDGEKLQHASTTIEQAENFAEHLKKLGITSAEAGYKSADPVVKVAMEDRELLQQAGYDVRENPLGAKKEPVGALSSAVSERVDPFAGRAR